MSKKPVVKHGYNRDKDRFSLSLKRFSLKKKWLRTELVQALLRILDKKSVRKKRGSRGIDPIKNTRIEEVED